MTRNPSLRASVSQRLGLAENATDEQIFAALDARTAAPRQSPGDRLYQAAWGDDERDLVDLPPEDSSLYTQAWGA